MKHPITNTWPFHKYKAFIIYNKESMLSKWSVTRTLSTAKRCGINAELFNGVHKDDSERTMKKFGLEWHPMAHEWGHRMHHMESVAGCFLSHYSLWKKCVELKEPILILEHDVEFNKHIDFPIEDIEFDGILNIGQPIWGTWWEDPLNQERESRIEIRDISKCEKPHAAYGVFDSDRITYCGCERNFLIGAHSYIITPNAAKKLLKKAKTHGVDRADVFMDSESNVVADLLPYPASQIRRFSLIDVGWDEDVWQDSDFILPIYEQDAVYCNDEIVLPCSPNWSKWKEFQEKHPDMYSSLTEAQLQTKKALRFGKIIFDNKEVIKGEKDGLFKDYYDDGESLRCEGVIQDGEMHGEWVYYLIDGTVDSKFYLDMGKLTRMDRHSWRQNMKGRLGDIENG